MNLTYYRNFVKIVELGTITAAAKELFIAQPALSKQLKMIEEEYGAQLLTRGSKRLYLTNAGKILYDKAKRICLLEDAAFKEIEACVSGERGTLKLGLTPAFSDTMVEDFLLDFSEIYPNIDFEIVEENSEPLMNSVKKGIVEIAVIRAPTIVPPIFDVPLFFKEQFMIAYFKNGPWLSPDMDSVAFSELSGIPICTSRGIVDMITDNCLSAGFKPHYLSIASSRSKAFMWCRRGTAVTIYVGTCEKDKPEDPICHRPLVGKNTNTQRSFITLKERELSAVAKLFIEFCKDQAEQIK